jgi:hypothetical protein
MTTQQYRYTQGGGQVYCNQLMLASLLCHQINKLIWPAPFGIGTHIPARVEGSLRIALDYGVITKEVGDQLSDSVSLIFQTVDWPVSSKQVTDRIFVELV